MTGDRTLGKYAILEKLGEGAMGVVYKCFDPHVQRILALKTLHPGVNAREVMGGTSLASRFQNEARAAGRLSHPGIVAVYECDEDGGVMFIAMEYAEGESLEALLKRGVQFTDAEIVSVLGQLLEALDHAHQKGVWHRDIKPANIIVAPSGKLKITDFGIARIVDVSLTQASMMVGTPAFMAPEQFLGREIDHRVDIYSAGVLLYVLLTGRRPFEGATPEALMYNVVSAVPKAPSAIVGLARPRFYDAIIARALAKDPGERFASAREFKEAILSGPKQSGVVDAEADVDRTVIRIARGVPQASEAEAALSPTLSPVLESNVVVDHRTSQSASYVEDSVSATPPSAAPRRGMGKLLSPRSLALGSLAAAVVSSGIVYVGLRDPGTSVASPVPESQSELATPAPDKSLEHPLPTLVVEEPSPVTITRRGQTQCVVATTPNVPRPAHAEAHVTGNDLLLRLWDSGAVEEVRAMISGPQIDGTETAADRHGDLAVVVQGKLDVNSLNATMTVDIRWVRRSDREPVRTCRFITA